MSLTEFPKMNLLQLKHIIQLYTDDIAGNQAYITQLEKKNEQKVQQLIAFNKQMSDLDPNFEYTELGVEKYIETRIKELEIKWGMKIDKKKCCANYDSIDELVNRMVEQKFINQRKIMDKTWDKYLEKITDLQDLNENLKQQLEASDKTQEQTLLKKKT